jgi:hypothetical protein
MSIYQAYSLALQVFLRHMRPLLTMKWDIKTQILGHSLKHAHWSGLTKQFQPIIANFEQIVKVYVS